MQSMSMWQRFKLTQDRASKHGLALPDRAWDTWRNMDLDVWWRLMYDGTEAHALGLSGAQDNIRRCLDVVRTEVRWLERCNASERKRLQEMNWRASDKRL